MIMRFRNLWALVLVLPVFIFWQTSKADNFNLPTAPVYDDLWDVSRGTVITQSSSMDETYSANALFGAPGGQESGNVIFQDGYSPSYVHFVEWETPTEVTIGAFNLTATMDMPSPDGSNPSYARRSFARMRLYAWDGTGFVKFFDEAPALPYSPTVGGGNEMPFSVILPTTISASRWRGEFDQQVWTNSYGGFDVGNYAPRVVELDGFVPEPATLSLLIFGGLAFRRRQGT